MVSVDTKILGFNQYEKYGRHYLLFMNNSKD